MHALWESELRNSRLYLKTSVGLPKNDNAAHICLFSCASSYVKLFIACFISWNFKSLIISFIISMPPPSPHPPPITLNRKMKKKKETARTSFIYRMSYFLYIWKDFPVSYLTHNVPLKISVVKKHKSKKKLIWIKSMNMRNTKVTSMHNLTTQPLLPFPRFQYRKIKHYSQFLKSQGPELHFFFSDRCLTIPVYVTI